MMAGLGFAGVFAAGDSYEEAMAAIIAAVAQYNKTNGGTGSLVATVGEMRDGGPGVVITGEVTGAKKGIELLNAGVVWKAKLSGNTAGEALISIDRVEFMSGTEIQTNGRAIEGFDIIVLGGIIAAPEAIHAEWLRIDGGTITGDLFSITGFTLLGGTIKGSLTGGQGTGVVEIRNCVIDAPKITLGPSGDFIRLFVMENAVVNVGSISIENGYVDIEPTATTNLESKLNNCILSIYPNLTILGNVTIDGFTVYRGQTLNIPEGAKLTITTNNFKLEKGGKLVIDGKLVLPKGYNLAQLKGTITGKNAKEFMPKWWQKLPGWLQWIFRYILFGWIWMK